MVVLDILLFLQLLVAHPSVGAVAGTSTIGAGGTVTSIDFN